MAADQGAEFEQYRRPTKRDVFLQTMNEIVPWPELCVVNKPHYARGMGGRPSIGLRHERVPDASTLLKFRRLLGEHKLGEKLFVKVGDVLQAKDLTNERVRNRSESKIRARVEHVFGWVKRLWGYCGVR